MEIQVLQKIGIGAVLMVRLNLKLKSGRLDQMERMASIQVTLMYMN